MKLNQLLVELKIDTETYLQEDILKKGKKYYVVQKDDKKKIIAGTKEEGYLSLENAVKNMMSSTNKTFDILPFTKKQEKINTFIEKWKKDNKVKNPKAIRFYGFEVDKND